MRVKYLLIWDIIEFFRQFFRADSNRRRSGIYLEKYNL